MSYIIKILVVAIMVSALQADTVSTERPTDEPTTTSPTALYETAVQLMTVDTEVDGDYYHIVCVDGDKRTGNVMCHANDEKHWSTKHDTQVRLTCPGSGSGGVLSFIQVDIWATTKNVHCSVIEGGIGYRYVKLLLDVKGTTYLNYVADFYNP